MENTVKSLQNNRFDVYTVKTKEDAKNLVMSIIPSGSTVSSGGSMTLSEAGIIEALRSNPEITYLDRMIPGLSEEEKRTIMEKAMTCDYYLSSSNAITENGELYNVDGNSNRVSALLYGPKNVIIVAGKNKIVKNLEEAVKRVKEISAPLNAKRLSCKTYCEKEGKCIADGITNGCNSTARICSSYVIMAYQRHAGRVKIILVDENLGY